MDHVGQKNRSLGQIIEIPMVENQVAVIQIPAL